MQIPEQFDSVIPCISPDGSLIRVKDVARVELGSEGYSAFSRYGGRFAAGIAMRLATDADALETASNIDDYLEGAEAFFPQRLKAVYPFNTTLVVKISIHRVARTPGEVVLPVFLIMYLLPQNFRATLIPTIAVSVMPLGTFGVLPAPGYSINTLTMFAMMFVIDLSVDDAIVVAESMKRVISEDKLSPKETARKPMDQIADALVGVVIVLSAVFIPMAFLSRSVGVIYRQFSVTIVSAMVLLVVVAIVLTPTLYTTILKPVGGDHVHSQHGFFGWFNRRSGSATLRYQSGMSYVTWCVGCFVPIYLVLIDGLVSVLRTLPTGLLLDEDQGMLFT